MAHVLSSDLQETVFAYETTVIYSPRLYGVYRVFSWDVLPKYTLPVCSAQTRASDCHAYLSQTDGNEWP